MVMRPEDLRKMNPAQRNALSKAEVQARLKMQMKKPLKPKQTTPTKKATPIPMPKRSASGTARKITPGVKVKTSTPKPLVIKKKPMRVAPKKKTLDDFLLKGKRPPMKIKPGLKRPSDADVILKGYNDKKTINKYKKGK